MPPVIGMIIALPSEAARITGRRGWRNNGGYAFRRQSLPGGIDLLVGLSGPGVENARSTARRLVAQGAVALINTGVSGGLVPGVKPGALVIAESVRLVEACRLSGKWQTDRDVATQAAQCLASSRIPSHRGRILTVTQPVLSAVMKRKLGEEFRSLAVDMESAGIAMAAGEAGVSFFILRAVCDPLLQSIPSWLFDSLKNDGSIHLQLLFGQVLRRPPAMIELFRMQFRFRTACKALAEAWALLCASGFLSLLAAASPRR